MVVNKKLKVEVAYAALDRQCLLLVEVPAGSTIREVIYASGILREFPCIDLAKQLVGVFSKRRTLEDTINDGDRIEIYRPLLIDPKEARRAKAKSRQALRR